MKFTLAESGCNMSARPGCTNLTHPGAEQDIVESLPVLVLNVHSRCNCRCIMCDIWKREEASEIRVADLERHRVALRRLGVRWVVLTGGEPLMHSDLAALCAWLRADDIRLTLLTTGLLLWKRAALVARFFADVNVSLDGPAELHDSIRRVHGSFRLVRQGVDALRDQRDDIRITARTTVQKANFHALGSTVEAAKQMGLDGISFLAADVTSKAFNRPLVWPVERQNEISLSRTEVDRLEEEVERLIVEHAADIAAGYIAEGAQKLRRIVRHFRAQLGLEEAIAPVCNAPWTSAVIVADGAVRQCFFHNVIGNIHDSALDQVLNSERGRDFRRHLVMADDPTCRQCVCSLNYRGQARGTVL